MSGKRFALITDADARQIATGSTVELAPGGLVTPLARETLQARRVTVVPAGAAVDPALPADLAPVSPVTRVAIGADTLGRALQQAVVAHLRRAGKAVTDVGAGSGETADVMDLASAVGQMVVRREADAGILIDGTGLASAIAANKIRGVRAAACGSPALARDARECAGANVLALGALHLATAEALEVIDTWLSTPMTDPVQLRRLLKLRRLEERF